MKNKHVYGRDTYREIKSFLIGHLVHEKHTTQSIMPNLKGWEQKQLFEIHLANQQKYCKGKKTFFLFCLLSNIITTIKIIRCS